MTPLSAEEEEFVNHWNDILTYPLITDVAEALSEPPQVLAAKFRNLRKRCLLLDRKDRMEIAAPKNRSLAGEQWVSLLGFDGTYQVSNLGRIRSLDRRVNNRFYKGQLIKANSNSLGYFFVNLANAGVHRTMSVHRAVLESFTGRKEKMVVRHVDNNKANNRLENLSWGTHADNMQDLERDYDAAALTILDHLSDS